MPRCPHRQVLAPPSLASLSLCSHSREGKEATIFARLPTKSTKMKLKIRWTLFVLLCLPPYLPVPLHHPPAAAFQYWLMPSDWMKLRQQKRQSRATRDCVWIHGCQLSKRHKIWLFSLSTSLSRFLFLPLFCCIFQPVVLPVKQSLPPFHSPFFHTHTTITIKVAHFPVTRFYFWFPVSVWLMLSPSLSLSLVSFSACRRAALNSLLACTNMSAATPFLFAIKKHVCPVVAGNNGEICSKYVSNCQQQHVWEEERGR